MSTQRNGRPQGFPCACYADKSKWWMRGAHTSACAAAVERCKQTAVCVACSGLHCTVVQGLGMSFRWLRCGSNDGIRLCAVVVRLLLPATSPLSCSFSGSVQLGHPRMWAGSHHGNLHRVCTPLPHPLIVHGLCACGHTGLVRFTVAESVSFAMQGFRAGQHQLLARAVHAGHAERCIRSSRHHPRRI